VLAGVAETQVDVGIAKITYDETRLKKKDLKRAVEEAGYVVVNL
jgi:copper chaperone CopZ